MQKSEYQLCSTEFQLRFLILSSTIVSAPKHLGDMPSFPISIIFHSSKGNPSSRMTIYNAFFLGVEDAVNKSDPTKIKWRVTSSHTVM